VEPRKRNEAKEHDTASFLATLMRRTIRKRDGPLLDVYRRLPREQAEEQRAAFPLSLCTRVRKMSTRCSFLISLHTSPSLSFSFNSPYNACSTPNEYVNVFLSKTLFPSPTSFPFVSSASSSRVSITSSRRWAWPTVIPEKET
jgi:hypothetical protein